MHRNAGRITGVVCGVRVEWIDDARMRDIRRLDKLVDELAKGRLWRDGRRAAVPASSLSRRGPAATIVALQPSHDTSVRAPARRIAGSCARTAVSPRRVAASLRQDAPVRRFRP